MTGRSRLRVDPSFVVGLVSTLIALTAFVWVSRRPASPTVLGGRFPAALIEYAREAGLVRERGGVAAPDTLTEVSDLLCTACAQIEAQHGGLIDSLVSAGALFHRVVEMPMQPGSVLVTAYSSCASRYAAPDSYWRLRASLFASQASLRTAYPVETALEALALESGVDAPRTRACLESEVPAMSPRKVELSRLASAAGLTMTPSFWFGAEFVRADQIRKVIRPLENQSR